jgi:hypothetical protein
MTPCPDIGFYTDSTLSTLNTAGLYWNEVAKTRRSTAWPAIRSGANLMLWAGHVWAAGLRVLGIRRIINPAMSTAAITSLSPQENEAPVWLYT